MISRRASDPNRLSPSLQALFIRGLRRGAVCAFCLFLLLATTGCFGLAKGRCYIDDARYLRLREQFVQTGSLQRVENQMQAEGWIACERNEFHYRLVKDLDLESNPESLGPQPELVP